jgi:hypothetical protein
MLNGSNIKTFHAAFTSAAASEHHDDEQNDFDNDNDDDGEDNTARLDHQRRHSTSENVLALQRVKSLTQRNKMVRDAVFLCLCIVSDFACCFLLSFIHV